MARLGEHLIAAKLLTPEQLELALRAQVMWGARIGTNLVELGAVDLDAIAEALSHQHRIPAAFARHFEKADRGIQRRLPAELAERHAAVPLMRVKIGKIVIAVIDPLPHDAVVEIAAAYGEGPEVLVQSVAAELRMRYQLEHVYQIARDSRFLRARGRTWPPFPTFDPDELVFEDSAVSAPVENRDELQAMHEAAVEKERAERQAARATPPSSPHPAATPPPPPVRSSQPLPAAPAPAPDPSTSGSIDLDFDGEDVSAALDAITPDTPPEPAPPDEPTGRERRSYVRMITDEVPALPARQQLGRIAIRRVAVPAEPQYTSLADATRAIRRGTDRDRVAELVVAMLERFAPACEAAILLVVRGETAVGWKGFCRSGAALPQMAVPLEEPGLVPSTIHGKGATHADSAELGPIDRLLVSSLMCGNDVDGRSLDVVPVTIAGQVMLVIALVSSRELELPNVTAIATATGAGFARLMRDASR